MGLILFGGGGTREGGFTYFKCCKKFLIMQYAQILFDNFFYELTPEAKDQKRPRLL